MLDKSKRYLIVGLGLLGGKYALELTRAGLHRGRHQPQRGSLAVCP